MTLRGTALARTFAAAFQALVEHAKAHPSEAAQLADVVASHLRSSYPQSLSALPDPQLTPAVATLPLHMDTRGGSVDLYRSEDGALVLLVTDMSHDAAVTISEQQLATMVQAAGAKEAA